MIYSQYLYKRIINVLRGGEVWIRYKELKGVYGNYNRDTELITINPHYKLRVRTIIHEVLHHIYFLYPEYKIKKMEALVYNNISKIQLERLLYYANKITV